MTEPARAPAAQPLRSRRERGRDPEPARRRRGERGFTLVELMVAMVLTTILIMVAMQVGVIVLTGYHRHRDAVGIQRAARGTLDLLSDAVRNASAGVPSGNLVDGAGCTTMEVARVVNHDDAPDELYVMSAVGGVVTSLREDYLDTDSSATVLDGTGLAVGDLVIVTNFDQGHVLRVNQVTDNGTTWTIGLDSPCSGMTYHYLRGSLMLRARVSHFYVDDVGGIPTMFLDDDSDGPDVPEPLAEGIEDFQVAVGVDADRDGTVADAEWYYHAVGDPDPPPMATQVWRAIRMTVVAPATQEQVDADWSARPTAEDHAGGSPDGYKRRMVSTIVEIRNLEGSP